MGRPFKTYLNGSKIYSCSSCRCHSADHDDIISKVRHELQGVVVPCNDVQHTRRCRRFKAGMVERTCSTTRKCTRVPACNVLVNTVVQNIL